MEWLVAKTPFRVIIWYSVGTVTRE
jgi:hypothetical protein